MENTPLSVTRGKNPGQVKHSFVCVVDVSGRCATYHAHVSEEGASAKYNYTDCPSRLGFLEQILAKKFGDLRF